MMPVPITYTEPELAVFIMKTARGVTSALTWVDQASVQDVIDETLLAYPVPDVALATDIRKLRILARYHTWKAAVEQLAGKIPVTLTGTTWNRDRLQAQAKVALDLARDEASVYLGEIEDATTEGEGVISITSIGSWTNDPYRSGR
jgi:hypothetical protein